MTSDLLPAALLAFLLAIVSATARMLPFGQADLLIRVPDASHVSALLLAARAGAALKSLPAPGFAVLHGDSAQIRAASGLAVIWKGKSPCSIN